MSVRRGRATGGAGERDEVVARALRDLPVPPHRVTFWADLERRLGADADAPAAAAGTRLDTSELPAVAALGERRTARRTPLLVAAAVLVLLGAVGFVTLAGDDGDDDGTELADHPLDDDAGTTEREASSTTAEADTFSSAPAETTMASVATAPGTSPDGTVIAWLDSLGRGDVAAAAALTGPRTIAYIESLGPEVTLERFLTESEEGFGAWAGSDDRQVSVLPIEPLAFDGGTLQVVVVSGTYPGEGGDAGTRVDVLPVVDDGEGYRVEHLAHDPARDNDPVFTLPGETETGLGSMAPAEEINVFVPAHGTVYFQLDGGEVGSDVTSDVAGDVFALFNPDGDLTPGEHVLVLVAVGDDGTIAHFGGTFTVEP